MKKNVGSIDKVIRLIIAIVAIYFAYAGGLEAAWAGVLYAVGAILLFTILTGSCPLYSIVGANTSKK